MGRPREHGDVTRAALLTAAGDILGAEGAAGVSVRRVAEHAGTSTRAVYSLFGDKEGLLRALFHEEAELMRRHHEAVPVMDDPTDDPVTEIAALAQAYRAAAKEQPNLYAIYLGQSAPGLAIEPADVALAYRSFERVLDTLRRMAGAGRLGGRSPEQVTFQMWALVHGLASLELQGLLGDEAVADRAWADAVRAVMAGYALPA